MYIRVLTREYIFICRSISTEMCTIVQVKGRHPTDTAFHMEVYTHDDSSDLDQRYAIGDFRGGTNVQDWTKFSGSSLVVETKHLPHGIPLYWTVKVKNSEGLESATSCQLHTYDNTVTDGRLEASCPFSSHPHTINATLMAFDDSDILNSTIKGLGYSPGVYGTEVLPWDPLPLINSRGRTGVSGFLKDYSEGRSGRLTKTPLREITANTDNDCAQECSIYGSGKQCISFDFEYHTQKCLLHDVIEGPFAKLRISGSYKNFDRLDVGFNSYIQYKGVLLTHGTVYYINAVLTNALQYTSVLSSAGTMVDFTPPKSGYLGSLVFYDRMSADGCHAAVTQRCRDVTWLENHRYTLSF